LVSFRDSVTTEIYTLSLHDALPILAGEIHADDGEVWRRPGSRVSYLAQELPDADDTSVYDFVAAGLGETGDLLRGFHQLTTHGTDEAALEELGKLQPALDAKEGWSLQQQ